jgi:processing peptidase subunit beta
VQPKLGLQFSKSGLTDFGELPQGEIPEALKYDRPSQVTELENGIRVATEKWMSPLASITVSVRAGSRYETLENSSVS